MQFQYWPRAGGSIETFFSKLIVGLIATTQNATAQSFYPKLPSDSLLNIRCFVALKPLLKAGRKSMGALCCEIFHKNMCFSTKSKVCFSMMSFI